MGHTSACIMPDFSGWLPASVVMTPSGLSLISSGGKLWDPRNQEQLSFWEYVKAQGGAWMWKYVEGDVSAMKWLAMAIQNGTAIIVID